MKNRFRATKLLLLSSSLLLTGVSQADKLIHYKFDVDNGTIVANDGTLVDGVLAGAGAYGASKDATFGTAFYGNRDVADDAHIVTQLTGDDLGFGAGGVYTAMAWINWTGTLGNADHMVFGQDDGVADGNAAQLHHGIRDDSAINVHFGGWGGDQDIADAGTVVPATWTHVAWQFDGTEKVVFVNGVETARAAGNNITNPALTVLVGGTSRDGTLTNPYHSFNGAIDEVKVFNEVLTAAQVTIQMVVGDDLDSDGLTDDDEVNIYNTNPNLPDTDGDGLLDGVEVANGLDPNSGVGDDGAAGDPDGDTLSNIDEIQTHLTDPLSDDTDSDNLKDQDELNTHLTNPRIADTDIDGLNDGDELNTHMTDPLVADSDSDGLNDGVEVNTHLTDPNLADSDSDTFNDNVEILAGTNPNDAASFPSSTPPDPLLYYTFDNDSGTSVENFGTLATAGTTSGNVTYAASKDGTFGSAFVGNRVLDNDAFVSTGFTGDDLGFGSGGIYTAMAWVLWDGGSGNGDHMVFGQRTNSATNVAQLHHGIRDDSPANVHFGGWGGTQDIADAGTVVATEWTHVTWQYDGTDAVVYVNGAETSRAAKNSITDPSFEVIVGAHSRDSNLSPDPGNSFNGLIDEVRIYAAVLNPAQIAVAMIPDGSAAQELAVTDISTDAGANTVTLTFNSRPGKTYSLLSSLTLDEGLAGYTVVDPTVGADAVINETTFTFPMPTSGGAPEKKIFFFIQENP